jgi:hypothetical protein
MEAQDKEAGALPKMEAGILPKMEAQGQGSADMVRESVRFLVSGR